MTHRERHPHYTDGCYACKIASVAIGAAALPNRKHEAADTGRRERQLDRDLDAYARLRRNGEQPPKIAGSARLEQEATASIEVTRGKKLGATARSLSEDLQAARTVA